MKNSKHILQITYSLKAAGIETFVVNLYRAIDREKIQFDFVSYYDGGHKEFYDKAVQEMGGKIYKLGYPQRRKIINNIKIRVRLYKCIKNNGYEIVHVHGSSGVAILEVMIAKLAGARKVIIQSHSSDISHDASFGRLQKCLTFLARPLWGIFCDHFFACSNNSARWLYTKKQCEKVVLIQNGIFTKRFFPSVEQYHEWREKHGIDSKELLVGHVGSFTPAKNHSYIVEIFKSLHGLCSESRLVLLGDGPYRDKIKKQISENELDESVLFTGVSEEVAQWMNACDVLIFPSLYEGLPLVCVEAQYVATPIIVSNTVTREVAISDKIYYLDINESPSVWAEKILSIKTKTFQRDLYTNKFDIESVASRMEKFYMES